jgi:hypothetical protein
MPYVTFRTNQVLEFANVYKSVCLNSLFRTLKRRRWIVINTDVLLRWTDSLYCGWVYVLQVTTWPVADCKNTPSTTEVVSRQCWEGLRKMNTVSQSRRCNSRRSKRVHSKLVWNIDTTRETFLCFRISKTFSKGIRTRCLTLIGTQLPTKI